MYARSCNDPEHEAARARQRELIADAEHGTPCLVCGAPILNGIGHDAGCMADRLAERCDYCAAPMYVVVRGHHHTENGVDVTRALR
jgi:hypothetical protein